MPDEKVTARLGLDHPLSLGPVSLSEPNDLIVVEQLQTFLVEEGIGQLPGSTPDTAVPSIWLQPRQGAPMPRQKDGEWLENVTVTLNDTNLAGPPGVEAWIEEAFIEVLIRSKGAGEGKLLHRAIRTLLHPVGKLSGRASWTMVELPVLYSTIWRAEQPLPPVGDGETYDRSAHYRIACARSNLVT